MIGLFMLSFFLFLLYSVLVGCMFLKNCPFHLGCQIHWHIIAHSILLWFFVLFCFFVFLQYELSEKAMASHSCRSSQSTELSSVCDTAGSHCCCSVTKSCLTLSDPMDCSPPGSSIHGIFQARTLEWVAISFSRGSSQSRDRTPVSLFVGRHFYQLSHQGSYYKLLLSNK